jgi:hypothetical protein
MCFAMPAAAKLGETVPQLVARFGKNYTIESDAAGKRYRFRSEKLSVDVLVSNDVSVAETYFSKHPLAPNGEPPNDIVRAILKTNVPQTRWLEIDAAPFGADYALRSSDQKHVTFLKYKGPQPEGSVWTMTVGTTNVLSSIATAPSPLGPEMTPVEPSATPESGPKSGETKAEYEQRVLAEQRAKNAMAQAPTPVPTQDFRRQSTKTKWDEAQRSWVPAQSQQP